MYACSATQGVTSQSMRFVSTDVQAIIRVKGRIQAKKISKDITNGLETLVEPISLVLSEVAESFTYRGLIYCMPTKIYATVEKISEKPVYVYNDSLIIDSNADPGVYEVDYMGEKLLVQIKEDKTVIIYEVLKSEE